MAAQTSSPAGAVPALSEPTPAPDDAGQASPPSLLDKGKRKLLGLGKKHANDADRPANAHGQPASHHPRAMSPPTSAPAGLVSPPLSPPSAAGASPSGSPRMRPAGVAASPSRRANRSSSPGLLHSPASSQIFERNVQDSVSDLDRSELSPHLPTHIQTEDHIPPVLEASSLAITDNHLNPDEVEIVMHSAHQPASINVAGSRDSILLASHEELPAAASPLSPPEGPDAASNYASLDTTDVRRLSFISFADVVQAEHVEGDRDAVQFMSLSSTANRSPSPVRSPASSHGGFSASPPTSGAASEKGADYATPLSMRAPNSPTAGQLHGTQSPPVGGELQIETMRQALRKTGSGDLSAARTPAPPTMGLGDSPADPAPSR